MNGQIFYDIIFFIIILSFIGFLVKIGILAGKTNNKEGKINSFTGAILLSFIGVYYLVSSLIGSPIVVYPFNSLMIIWVIIILSIQSTYILSKIKSKIHIKIPKFIKNEDFTFFHEIQRKLTHLVGLLLIVCYFWVSVPVFSMIQELIIMFQSMNANIWGIVIINVNPNYIPQMISIFAIFCTGILILIPDIIRILNYKYSIFKQFANVMREKERNAVGPHICLIIGCLVPMILISEYLISIAGAVIAIFSDAAASLIGRRYGKHKLPFAKRTGKSYEGLIGGFVVAILTPLPILLWGYNVGISILLALIGAIVVSIIDILTPIVTDNYINPIFASFIMYGIYFLLIL
ncbi:MAG: hypothetical protein ACTSPY_09860 [Candidatus Helarchaeota archaeon]